MTDIEVKSKYLKNPNKNKFQINNINSNLEIDNDEAQTEKAEPESELKSDDVFCVPFQPPALPAAPVTKPSSSLPNLKPAKPAQLNYEEPEWSSKPPAAIGENELDDEGFCKHYYLEVIKNGTIVEKIKLNKEYLTFGRLDTCDVLCEHPSLSRYHTILQYSNGEINDKYPEGFYIYDLNSTHGTFLNKAKLPPNQYMPLKLDCMFKLGLSTRIYILHGPKPLGNSDDLQINLTHEQMKKVKEKYSRIALKLKIQKELEEEEEKQNEDKGGKSIDWGMSMEEGDEKTSGAGVDEENLGAENKEKNPFSVIEEEDESFYSSDPKKALKNYFDREGDELEYDVEELGPGKYKCSIRLPITNNYGQPIYAEITHDGKKKDSMTACALEACRILNAEGVLKTSRQESAKRKMEKDWESNDYYDSDDDTYLDRTGEVEKKRIQRMAKLGKLDDNASKSLAGSNRKVLTFDIIISDIKTFYAEQKDIETKLEKCKDVSKAINEDDVDSYIRSLKMGNKIDTVTRAKMRRRLVELKAELTKLDKLLNAAKPSGFDVQKFKDELEKEFTSSNEKSQVEVHEESVKKEEIQETRIEEKKMEIEPIREPQIETTKIKSDNLIEEQNKEKKLEQVEHKEIKKAPANIKKVKKVEVETKPLEEEIDYEKTYKQNPKDYAVWVPPEGN